ncbi:unnamed protein product [Arabidopsis halleri]
MVTKRRNQPREIHSFMMSLLVAGFSDRKAEILFLMVTCMLQMIESGDLLIF